MSFIDTVTKKRWLAFAGLFWFAYLIFHAASLLIFHSSAEAFNDFYQNYRTTFWYWLMLFLLFLTLIFHVAVAIARQFDNLKKGGRYRINYPKAVPRIIAWAGAGVVLVFIVFHFVQMQLLDRSNLYEEMRVIFSKPLMLVIYGFGILALGIHTHHGLTNVWQTLGVSPKRYFVPTGFLVALVMLGFLSIPIGIFYA